MDRNGLIHFEYQDIPQTGTRIVALDCTIKQLQPVAYLKDGKPMLKLPEVTIKDCTHIDGCIYYHLGRVPDTVMVDLIEKFQKLAKEDGWKENKGFNFILPDNG